MADYKAMYHVLFAATEDALVLLETCGASSEEPAISMQVRVLLENAQQKCEDIYTET